MNLSRNGQPRPPYQKGQLALVCGPLLLRLCPHMAEKHTTRRRYITGKLVQRPADLMTAFLDSSTTLLCAVDSRGEFVVFNKACERITGYSYEEMAGRSFFALFDPVEHKRLKELWSTRAARSADDGELELPWVGKDGKVHRIRWFFTRFYDALGNIEFHAGIGQDITEAVEAGRALKESEARFASIFKGTAAVMFLTDPLSGSIVDANAAAADFYGYPLDRLRQLFVWDINISVDKPTTLERLARAMTSAVSRFVVQHRLASGEIRDVDVYTCPISVGDRVLLHSIVHDTTERHRAERALKESEERFRTLIEHATEAICIADGQGRNIEANSHACRMFGYTREEFARIGVADTVPPADRPLIGQRFAKMREGVPQRWERDLIRKDGTQFPVEISARFLPDGRLLAIMRDVTERKRAEEALRESEQRFRNLADAAPVFIWLANEKGGRTYFSRGWVEFTGRALDDEIGDGWMQGVHEQDMQRVADMLADARLSRQDFNLEYRLRASDGEFRWVLDRGVPRFSERGEFAGYIGSCLDITERKRAEEALRVSERQYRELMEQSGDGIFIFDDRARITDVNTRFSEILGYSKAEACIMDATRLVDPVAKSRIPLRFSEMDAGKTLRIDVELISKDGRRVPLDVSARKVAPGRYQAVFRDMTERRKVELALLESERRLTTLLANLPGMAYRCRNDRDWTMEFVSEGAAELTGYSVDELVGGGISFGVHVIHQEDQLRIWEEVQAALTERRGFTLNYRIRRKDGAMSWVWEQGRGISNNQGELVALEGFITDVTDRRIAEEALRQSQQRYQAFIAQSTEGVWRFEFSEPIDLSMDIETQVDLVIHGGVLEECNDEMAKMYGYSRADEIIGVRISQLLDMSDPSNREMFRVFARARYRITDLESHEIGRGGLHRYFLNNVVGIIENNRLIRIWGTQRDITERLLAAQALAESEDRYKRLSGATAEAIIIHEQGRVIDANQRAADMFGYSPEELHSLLAFNLATPETRQTVIDNVRNGVETPYEAVGLRKDGSRFPGEITARNLALGGKQVRVVAIRDITERKRAEEALKREAGIVRLMQRVAQAANESSSSFDAMRTAIDEICAYTGWPLGHAYLVDPASGELVPADIWHLDTPELHAEFKSMNMATRFAAGVGLPGAVLRDRRPYWIEDVANDAKFPGGRTKVGLGIASGFAFPVLIGREVAAVLEFGSAKPAAVDAQLLDIMANIGTQLGRVVERERVNEILEARVAERTRQLEAANKELSQRAIELTAINKELESFSYSVSHDLRAPLRGIYGFSQALQEDFGARLGADGEAMLERIKSASQRMGRLIDDLLGLSRVTRAEMQRETVDLSAMAKEVCGELEKANKGRNVAIHIQPGITATGDPRLLRVLLQNLIDNAFKFTSRTEAARISFTCEPTEQGPGYTITDNGAGFDMRYADKLFGAFQRLHSLKEFEGTGIGLATVQRIVHRHGGRVRAKGEVGKGASIQFTLGGGTV